MNHYIRIQVLREFVFAAHKNNGSYAVMETLGWGIAKFSLFHSISTADISLVHRSQNTD